MEAKVAMLSLALACLMGLAAGAPGGLSNEKPANEVVSKIVADLEQEIKLNHCEIKSIEPISFKTQVVAGTNYFVKCRVLDDQQRESFVHLRVYRDLKSRIELHGIRKELSSSEPIGYFAPDKADE